MSKIVVFKESYKTKSLLDSNLSFFVATQEWMGFKKKMKSKKAIYGLFDWKLYWMKEPINSAEDTICHLVLFSFI